MAEIFKVEIITPDRIFYEGEAEFLEITTAAGDVGIYAKHIPMTTVLAPGRVSIHKDGVTHIICAYFRIGNNGKHVDNFNSGGMVAPVDEATGIVRAPAIDKTKVLYQNHPATGSPIQGFQFPFWEEAKEMVRQAAGRVDGMGYIGWDIAFAPDGPKIIEGNNFPGHDIYQLPEHTPDRIGMMPKFNV